MVEDFEKDRAGSKGIINAKRAEEGGGSAERSPMRLNKGRIESIDSGTSGADVDRKLWETEEAFSSEVHSAI